MLLAALALAASVTDVKTHSIVISVDKQENVIITMDGRKITCAELDKYLRSETNGHATGFDCKKLEPRINH